jgi:hypothetical protein
VHDVDGNRTACASFEFYKGGSLSQDPGSARPIGGAGGTNGTGADGGAGPSRISAMPSVTLIGAAGLLSASCSG